MLEAVDGELIVLCVYVFVLWLQCYNLEPLKKDVARQVTYGKDSFKICKLLEKKNPDFCSMRYRTSLLRIRSTQCSSSTSEPTLFGCMIL